MIEIIKKIAKENHYGFTYDLEKNQLVKKGISVAYLETQNSFDDEGLKKAIEHAANHENIVGGWQYENKYYYDSIKLFENTNLKEAIDFGKQNKQIAIFDLTNLKEITLQ